MEETKPSTPPITGTDETIPASVKTPSTPPTPVIKLHSSKSIRFDPNTSNPKIETKVTKASENTASNAPNLLHQIRKREFVLNAAKKAPPIPPKKPSSSSGTKSTGGNTPTSNSSFARKKTPQSTVTPKSSKRDLKPTIPNNTIPQTDDSINKNNKKESFFTPSLLEIASKKLADIFVEKPTCFIDLVTDPYYSSLLAAPSDEKQAPEISLNSKKTLLNPKIVELIDLVSSKLSVDVPLQYSLPYINSENYWEKCCRSRWEAGELGRFIHSDSIVNTPHKKVSSLKISTDDLEFAIQQLNQNSSENPNENPILTLSKNKTWKSLYCEKNMEDFIENVQPLDSIIRELEVLERQPLPEKPTSSTTTELHGLYVLREKNQIDLQKQLKKNKPINETKNPSISLHQIDTLVNNQLNGNNSLNSDGTGLPPPSPVAVESTSGVSINLSSPDNTENLEDLEEQQTQIAENLEKLEHDDQEIDDKHIEAEIVPNPCKKFEELHTHKMKPNLNYYLLHENENSAKNLPFLDYTNKLQHLYDGLDSRYSSRLRNITSNDDSFTFYDNAILKTYYKTFENSSQKSKTQHIPLAMDFWLLTKRKSNLNDLKSNLSFFPSASSTSQDSANPMSNNNLGISKMSFNRIAVMVKYIQKRNSQKLKILCTISSPFIKELEIKTLRSHINLKIFFKYLPNLKSLRLNYMVFNSGMSFEIGMPGMNMKDCRQLSDNLSNEDDDDEETELESQESSYDDEIMMHVEDYERMKEELENKHKRILNSQAPVPVPINDKKEKIVEKKETSTRKAKLRKLDLSENLIDNDMLTCVTKGLIKNKTVESLNLAFNKISGLDGGKLIGAIIFNNANVASSSISSKMTKKALANSFGSLKELNLCDNNIGDGVKYISEALKESKFLIKLNLRMNSISDEEGANLAMGVFKHPSLSILDVSMNNLGLKTAKFFAKYAIFEDRSNLKEISFSGNPIGEDGAEILFEAFQQSLICYYMDLTKCKSKKFNDFFEKK